MEINYWLINNLFKSHFLHFLSFSCKKTNERKCIEKMLRKDYASN